jgi:hypothetical protein
MRVFGDFEEKGYHFRAFIPDAASEGIAFRVEIMHAEKPLHEFRLPMHCEPRYGPDVGDVRALEAVTAAILSLLPEPAQFGKAAADRIDATVAEMS